MTIFEFVSRGLLRRFVARQRLTDIERRNLGDFYRRNPVGPPAIMTASLGGHVRGRA